MYSAHSYRCTRGYPTTVGTGDSACAQIIIRLPDIFKTSFQPDAIHRIDCYHIPAPIGHHTSAFCIQKLFNILEKCKGADDTETCQVANIKSVIDKLQEVVDDDTRWKVLEYVEGSHLRIMIVLSWKTVLTNPRIKLIKLHNLRGAASLAGPFYRHHELLDFQKLLSLFPEQHKVSYAIDRLGAALIQEVERKHFKVVSSVLHFIENGNGAAYLDDDTNTNAMDNAFTKPTLQSLQAAIDVSRYITIELKPYQIATIAWALDRENYGYTTDCFQIRKGEENEENTTSQLFLSFRNNYNRWICKQDDEPCPDIRGGLILEEMGMGKTLEMLAVIIASDYTSYAAAAAAATNAKAVLDADADDNHTARSARRVGLDVGLGIVSTDPGVTATTSSDDVDVDVLMDTEPAADVVNMATEIAHSECSGTGVDQTDADAKAAAPSIFTIFTYSGPLPEQKHEHNAGGTLVIVPLSLMNQWVYEIETKIVNGAAVLRPLQYHGPRRHTFADLHERPVVITSYETVTADDRLFRSVKRTQEVKACVSWRCPGVRYIAREKIERAQLQANDVITWGGEVLYQVHKIVGKTSIQVCRYDAMGGEGDVEVHTLKYPKGTDIHAIPRVGTVKECNLVHANALTPICVTCGSKCEDFGLEEFVSRVLCTPLEAICWKRIVLDESHKLQCTATAQFRCISKLTSPLKWCMTGTPMPRSVDNLKGQFQFLGIPVVKLTQATIPWIADSMIRHTKESCLVDVAGVTALPSITYRDIVVALPHDDFTNYTLARDASRACYAGQVDGDASFYPRMYQCLTRERRACTVITSTLKAARQCRVGTAPGQSLPAIPGDALNLGDDCPVCYEAIPYPVVLSCRHCFCHECLLATLDMGDHKCPLCKSVLSGREVLQAQRACRAVAASLLTTVAPMLPAPDVLGVTGPGSTACLPKLDALMAVIGNGRPTLVYTQFDDAVHSLKALLEERSVSVEVLTGSCTRLSREQAIVRFRETVAGVLVLSLRTAAVGLNLIHASQVVFMEPVMNTGLEAQACGRVYRLGQKNAVDVIHLIAKDTIDERIRRFRDIDTSDVFGSEIRVGKVCVVMSEGQRKLWRAQRLQNLIQI